jgi:hypothetical protein
LPEEDGGIVTVDLSERAPSLRQAGILSQEVPVVITWLPDHLPEQLVCILWAYGLPTQAIWGGRLLTRGYSEYQWTLDLSLELTSKEGETILGAMYPDPLDEFDQLNRPGVWESFEEVLETEEGLRELLAGLEQRSRWNSCRGT